MRVAKFPNKIGTGKRTMILGSFNSFHNGHKSLLEVAKKTKNKIIIMIIDDLSILNRPTKKQFQSLKIRLQHIANLFIDEALVVKFNNEISDYSGRDFAQKLVDLYNVKTFVVGTDFAMGKGAKYNASDLKNDFNTTIVEPVRTSKGKISTSLLREFVEFGDVNMVRKYSPFYFTVDARVSADNSFQTSLFLPHNGIYASWAIVNDVKYWSIVRISNTKKHEILIPDLLVKNSGFNVQIEFVKKIRAVIKKESDIITTDDEIDSVKYLKNNL